MALPRVAFLLVGASGLALGSGLVLNQAQADPLGVIAGEVLDVSAARLEVDVDEGTAQLDGDVHARFGELDVNCDKVEIRYDESPKVKWARGIGGVRARLKGIEATATSFVVDVPGRSVELSGGVRLSRGKGWVTADVANIDLATRRVSMRMVKGSIPVEPPAP